MPYPAAVRACWVAAVLLATPACSSALTVGAARTTVPATVARATTVATVTTVTTVATATAAPTVVALPDPHLTPGATDPRVSQADIGQTICRSGYTTTVRPPEAVTAAIKVRAMAAYHRPGSLSSYELDHLIPLELGGAPADTDNMWPQPYEHTGARLAPPGTGAESKDKVENAARRAVCDGQLPLAAAQQAMAANWYAFGQSLGLL